MEVADLRQEVGELKRRVAWLEEKTVESDGGPPASDPRVEPEWPP
jgi:hypothetical protein